MNLITCSIVLYKNDEIVVRKAIDSVLQNVNISVKLYLIDNSPTNILSRISSDSRVEYIHNPLNPGFGASHNIAIKMAITEGSKYHLVLNPDVYFGNETIEKINLFMDSNPFIGNLMPMVYYPDGSHQYLCKLLPTPCDWIGRRFNPFSKIVKRRNELFELRFTGYKHIMEVPYLSGCFMFLRVVVLKEVGLFDENIFMYGEETDLCRRIIDKGFKTIFYPGVSIIHEFEKGSHKSLKLTWVGIKSAVYYFNKWGWFFDEKRKKINKETLRKINLVMNG